MPASHLPSPDTFLEDLSERPVDGLRPIVTLKPISGFPQNITLESFDEQGTVTLSIADRLQKFQLTDNDTKLDVCEVTFLDEEGLFTDPNQLIHGAVLDVAWGYPGAMSEARRLIVRRLKLGIMQGRKFARRRRGYLVTFTALAPGIIKHSAPSDTDDIYEGQSLSAVVQLVVTKLGYHTEANNNTKAIIRVPSEIDTPRVLITRAATENPYQFLARLAREHGLVFKYDSDGIFFGPRNVENPPSLTVDFDANLEGDHGLLLGFDLDGDLVFSVPAGLTVVAFRPSDQRTITARIDNATLNVPKNSTSEMAHTKKDATNDTTPDTETGLVQPPSTLTTAIYGVRTKASKLAAISKSHTVVEDFRPSTSEKVLAKRERYYNQRIKKRWKLRLKLVGTVKVFAGGTILIKNASTALLEGLWYVKEARHTVDSTGFITELICRRPKSGKHGATGKSQTVFGAVTVPGKGKKGEPTEQLSTALLANSEKFDNPNGKKRKRKPHDTDGEFFETRTRREKY